MWSPEPRGGTAGQNPASCSPERVGEVAGEALGVARNRFGCSLAAGTGPATAAVGGGCSGELLLGLSNKRLDGLQRVLGEVLG
jgi:hypothetical protein